MKTRLFSSLFLIFLTFLLVAGGSAQITLVEADTEASAVAYCENTGSQHHLHWDGRLEQTGSSVGGELPVTWVDEYSLVARSSYNGDPRPTLRNEDVETEVGGSYRASHGGIDGILHADGYDRDYVFMNVQVEVSGSLEGLVAGNTMATDADAATAAGVCRRSDFFPGPPSPPAPDEICESVWGAAVCHLLEACVEGRYPCDTDDPCTGYVGMQCQKVEDCLAGKWVCEAGLITDLVQTIIDRLGPIDACALLEQLGDAAEDFGIQSFECTE